jgi:hypothetical protein
VRRSHSFRHRQERVSWSRLELVVGDAGTEWTRCSAGKSRPDGGQQGSTAAEVRLAGLSGVALPVANHSQRWTVRTPGCKQEVVCSFKTRCHSMRPAKALHSEGLRVVGVSCRATACDGLVCRAFGDTGVARFSRIRPRSMPCAVAAFCGPWSIALLRRRDCPGDPEGRRKHGMWQRQSCCNIGHSLHNRCRVLRSDRYRT